MATQIRPNRLEVSDRFPMLGFTVRTDGNVKRYEIAIGTSPDLFGPDGKSHRSRSNFYSTRASGLLPIERGESVYVLPPEVLARFVGQQKLYYGLAAAGNGAGKIEVVTMPGLGSPYINISGLTGRSLQRVRVLPNRQRMASNYGRAGSEMDWAGDVITPGTQPTAPAAGKNGADKNAATAAPVHYDDGYGPLSAAPAPAAATKPDAHPQAKSLADDSASGDDHGIEGPIPDNGAVTQALAQPPGISPEYPGASRFEPANKANYKTVSGTRTIDRIVIHITDGQSRLDRTVSWFQNPSARVSAHYVVGQDGEVVQMVKHNDIAWHASSANSDSIGIEHVARSPHEWDKKLGRTDPGMMPTEQEYCASAALVNWLCTQFSLPMDRTHILGHSEADPATTHTDCPNGVWDWDHYMDLVTSGSSKPGTATASALSATKSARWHLRDKAAALGENFDENWNDVEVIGQPETYSCWATAASMVVGWRDRMSIDIQALKKLFTGKSGVSSDQGLYATDDKKLADALELVAAPPQCYTVEGFRGLLENYGPLWVGIHTDDGWGHAVVVTGIFGDGSMDNTYVRIHDPWGRAPGTPAHPGSHNPTPGQGSRYTLTFAEFGKEYESYASSTPDGTVNVQILHASDTGGRTIGIGTDQTYALAVAEETESRKPDDLEKRDHDWKKHHHHHHHHHDDKDDKGGSHRQRPAAQALDADMQPVKLPQAAPVTGWKKQVIRGAVDALVAAGVPPMSAVVPLLIRLVNEQGFSVGIGLGGDAGLLGGAGLGFGIILAPNDDVGTFGSVEVNVGLLAGISAGARVIVIRGGIDTFNETGYALGVTVEDGPSVNAIALFNEQREFHGVSFQLGVGTALSPIQIFTGVQHSVSKAVTQSLAADDTDDQHGIEGPIPDEGAAAQALALSPEYPQASRFEPAASVNYRAVSGTRTINRVVIHITDGGAKIEGPIGWFKNPDQRDPDGNPIHVSAHYVIGQDGEVVQMVKHNDIAWHAGSANGDSIGIEHVANRRGLKPTPVEYCASATLANWLAGQFNIPIDRTHILGHSEADPKTKHSGCPNAVWDWDYYMGMVTSATCDTPQTQSQSYSMALPTAPGPKKKRARGMTLADAPARMVGNSPVNTVSGGEGNISWELDQFPGVKMASQAAAAPLQSAETIELSNWPYCDHGNGMRAAAWFKVDWKFSGQSLGQVRITPSGTQQGSKPLRVEARIEDGASRDVSTTALVVRFTYHFATEGPDVVAVTELKLYSDGSIDQNSNWMSQVAA
jgi:N-acetyl-anhydromuramyl-L-alanine amidase AmpD